MTTAVKTQKTRAVNSRSANTRDTKKLSKFGLWRKANPQGIITVIDWRAVNK